MRNATFKVGRQQLVQACDEFGETCMRFARADARHAAGAASCPGYRAFHLGTMRKNITIAGRLMKNVRR